jgi:hypothetical protein
MTTLRYLHRKNRAVEREMLRRSKRIRVQNRRKGRKAEQLYDHDVESILASSLMAPSWRHETEKIKEYLREHPQ